MNGELIAAQLEVAKNKIAGGDCRLAYDILCKLGPVPSSRQEREIKYNLLLCANKLQKLPEGKQLLQWLLKNGAGQAPEFFQFGLYYVLTGKTQKAVTWFKKALSKKNSKLYWSELALAIEQAGDFEAALNIYEKLVNRKHLKNSISMVEITAFGRIAGIRKLEESELEFLEKEFRKIEPDYLTERLAFVIAKAYRKVGDFVKELYWLNIANNLSRKNAGRRGVFFDIKREKEKNNLIRKVFSNSKLGWWPSTECKSDLYVVFLLGMPRSGTTLLEQILGAHSKIGNTGESRALAISLSKVFDSKFGSFSGQRFPIISNINKLNDRDVKNISDYYVAYQKLLTNSSIFTDKNLSNISWVGLAANIFPEAKFIYIERNPLDNAVSIFQQDFGSAEYSFRAEDCVAQYMEYKGLANYWNSLYPEKFLRVKYEDLCLNFNSEICRIFNFLELEIESRVFSFHERNNAVRTPSVAQVREKINSAQIEKWKRYDSMLEQAKLLLN